MNLNLIKIPVNSLFYGKIRAYSWSNLHLRFLVFDSKHISPLGRTPDGDFLCTTLRMKFFVRFWELCEIFCFYAGRVGEEIAQVLINTYTFTLLIGIEVKFKISL